MAAIKHKAQRVALFIDTQNLYHSAKNLYRARVNFANVLKESVAGRILVRAVAYVVTTESGEEKAFFDALTKIGIETKTKDLQIFYGGAKKADWDVGMAVDAAKLAPKLDAVILATGDGDFVPLVEYLKNGHGVQVEVIAFGKSASARLKDAADDFIDMSGEPRKFLMVPSRYNLLNMAAGAIGAGGDEADLSGEGGGSGDEPKVVGSDTDEN
ncbi:NYN domain-containing protein [Candidatus Kaiserbacteria bacterium]|nr:NYN domain-containing protein [Candidatus Kaiserbacteria bacterium]